MLDELSREYDFEYLFTPPYTPNLQPIETVWAVVKNHVASSFTYGRAITELKEQTYRSFDKITSDTVSKIIYRKTIPFANSLIEKIEGLEGTIDCITPSQ